MLYIDNDRLLRIMLGYDLPMPNEIQELARELYNSRNPMPRLSWATGNARLEDKEGK